MSTPLHKQRELLEKRANVWEQAKALIEKSEKEDRNLTAEEQESYDRMCSDMESLKARADREHRAAEIERDLETATTKGPRLEVDSSANLDAVEKSAEFRAYTHWMRTGQDTELRAMTVGTDADGGFAVSTPTLAQIAEFSEGSNVMRELLSVQTASNPFTMPRELTKVTVSGVDEAGTVLTSQATLGQASFTAFSLARITRVSDQLVADSAFDIVAYVVRTLGDASGSEQERLAINGTGSGEPKGILTFTTAGASGATPGWDAVQDLTYSVTEKYRRNGTFLGSDQTIRDLMKVKDDNNQPLWQRTLIPGQPDTLNGFVIRSSQHMPANANGNKVLCFGDFKRVAWLVDFAGGSVQRLDELYSATNEVGFKRHDRFDVRGLDQNAVKHYLRTS